MGHTINNKKEANNIDTSRRINLFSIDESSINSGFRCLSKFAFKCSVIQRRETVVLEFMSFEALGCKCGASISICTSRALILRALVWHLLGSTTVIMLPRILTHGGTRLRIDSHIQHFILAT